MADEVNEKPVKKEKKIKEAIPVGVDKDSYTRTYEHLEGQEKVNFMLPAGVGLPPELVVNINGVQFIVEAGKVVKLPVQVVEMLTERLESEGILKRKSEESVANMEKQ